MVRGPHEKVHFWISKFFYKFGLHDRLINYVPFDSTRQDEFVAHFRFSLGHSKVEKIDSIGLSDKAIFIVEPLT